MKKFLKARNILILIFIIVVVTLICLIKRGDASESKTYKYFSKLEKSNYTITLEVNENKKAKTTIVNDVDNGIFVYKHVGFDYSADEESNYTNISRDGVIYTINDDLKEYTVVRDDYTHTIFLDEITSCDYYTRGVSIINGKLLHYEHFKKDETDIKFYFQGDKLMYIKDQSDQEGKMQIFKVEEGINEELYEIPEDFKCVWNVEWENDLSENE